jgi:hypothetical protein
LVYWPVCVFSSSTERVRRSSEPESTKGTSWSRQSDTPDPASTSIAGSNPLPADRRWPNPNAERGGGGSETFTESCVHCVASVGECDSPCQRPDSRAQSSRPAAAPSPSSRSSFSCPVA